MSTGRSETRDFVARRAAGEVGKARVLEKATEIGYSFPTDEGQINRLYSAHLCRAALLEVAGAQDVDYDTVLVISGHATAFAYHPQRYQPLYATPDPQEVVDDRLASATGFRFERPESPQSAEDAWRYICYSVDMGKPVHGSWLDDVVFLGYEDHAEPSARRLLVRGGWNVQQWWDWEMFEKWQAEFGAMERIGEACSRVPVSKTLREVIAAMVRCADDDPRAHVRYLDHASYGLQGLKRFAEDIEDRTMDPDHWHAGWLGGHCVYRQIAGRDIAARYLERHLADFPETARAHIREAAALFHRAADAWTEWGHWLGTESGVTDVEDIRLLWLQPTRRRGGGAAIRTALRWETEAVRHLKLALARFGTP